MVQVRGTVHDVTDNPERVERIVVRAVEPRMHGTTYVTEESAQFPVVDGVLNFNVLPGPCVVAFLRPHGATTYEKLMVPDVAEATFRECLDAATLAEEGTKSALEKVVRQIQEELNKAVPLVEEVRTLHTDVSNDRTAVDGFAKAAQTSAAEAATSESNAKRSETAAGDFAAVATTAATEAVDAMDAAALSAAAFSIYTGAGSPEGRVKAPVGSVYTDSAATNGAIRWIKTSGTENNGWEVEYGDTGWRDIKNPSYSGDLLIRRVGAMVTIKLFRLSPSEDVPAPKIATLDLGFRPSGRSVGLLTKHNALMEQGRLWVDSASATILMGAEASATETWPTTLPFTGVHTYHTDKPWPTTLPGTPA